jgi:dipeptidyl aminopeptidase/acylaminoacyl peptidase
MLVWLVVLLLLAGCAQQSGQPAPTVAPTAAPEISAPGSPTMDTSAVTIVPPPTVTLIPTATDEPTPRSTATATVTATPDPYAGLTIGDLSSRSYGGGALQVAETIHISEAFTRTLVSYASDGLTVYGFMNVPFGPGPFPVALVLHGYIPPRQYGTIAYTTRYADVLARNGYLVIHPNYRNHPPSDETEAFAAGRPEADFRVGYAVDVLNLLAIVEEQAGKPGPLARADAQQLHLLGHSMGGGITLRVITVNPHVDAAVLYGSMSGDEAKNYERILQWSNGETGQVELATPAEDLQRISPIYHLSRISAAISIHHGEADDVVPPEWSVELCNLLQEAAKVVECFSYPGAPHSFHDETDWLFQQRVIDFFNRY